MSSPSSSTSLFVLFFSFFAIVSIQIANFTSLFHASKAVLVASENDYELVSSPSSSESSTSSTSEGFLGLMMNNNQDKYSNHNQKLPCYKIGAITEVKKIVSDGGEAKVSASPIASTKATISTKDSSKKSLLLSSTSTSTSSSSVPTDLTNLIRRKTAVIVLTYNRPTFLERTVKSIQRAFLNEKLDGHKYISIDGDDRATKITSRDLASPTSGINVIQHQHVNPPGDLTATFSLAAHYRFVFNEMFHKRDYENVIVLEDDMDVGFDFFTFFDAYEPVLNSDPTVWCISSWNDNAFAPPFDLSHQKVFRTSYFPGLGWMMKRNLWVDDLEKRWPSDNWDHWMRVSSTHKQRSCVVPFVSRNFNFGNQGSTASDEFYNKYLARAKTTGSEKEVTSWGRAQRSEMIRKFYEPDRDGNVMGISSSTFDFFDAKSRNKKIKSEEAYDEWIQSSIASGEVIHEASRITHSSSYVVDRSALAATDDDGGGGAAAKKSLVFAYTSEQFQNVLANVLTIHPFPRTHYKYTTWFTVPSATHGVVRNVFLVDRRLSPFALDSMKVVPDESLEPVAAKGPGISCSEVCRDHHGVVGGDGEPGAGGRQREVVYKCDATQFDFINSCETLAEVFTGCQCQQGWGEDIPNMEATSIHHPPPANCLVTEMKPTCEASHPLTTRLCPCVKA